MSKAIDNLTEAVKRAEKTRPRVGGFPYLAEALRQAGVTRNVWSLPGCQSLFLTLEGPVVMQGKPLIEGFADVPAFDESALLQALRVDQAGESSFPQFLDAAWRAGVIRYDVDLEARTVAYQGSNGEVYVEAYPAISIDQRRPWNSAAAARSSECPLLGASSSAHASSAHEVPGFPGVRVS